MTQKQDQHKVQELYIDVRASEVSIALLENKQLTELNKEYINTRFSVGDIYLGKVKRLMPGLNAAFVDVGYERDAFLHYLDLGPQFQSINKFLHIILSTKPKNIDFNRIKPEPEIDKNGKITDVLTVGQYILVQIAKEPISNKGPRLSSEISLAGRNLVVLPFGDKVSVSQKIKSHEEKKRLRRLIESIAPKNYGIIVRTAAESKMVAELDKELSGLTKKWETITEKLKGAKPPILVLGELDRTAAMLRDILSSSFNQIVVNNKETFDDVKLYITEIAPEKADIVKLYNGKTPLFDHYGIQRQIKTLFGKTVPFKNGAYLIIEHTEAAHVIDVNSGNRSNSEQNQENNALEINLLAAEEIARQLKLRDMGGIIVIDFIDLHDVVNKKKVYQKMIDSMQGERAKYHVTPLSRFCLMEITRQRVRPEIHVKTSERCPTCNGSGKISASINLVDEIENNMKFLLKKYTVKKLIIKTHPFVEAYINKGFLSVRKKWQKQFRQRIVVYPMMEYSYMEYHFFNESDEEIIF